MIDFDKIEEYVRDGYISKRKHPIQDLWIYNYTNFCQIRGFWNDETLSCRGLILDKDYNIVARPFKKFFNLYEYKGILPEKIKFYSPKLDGSLGILYKDLDGKFSIATRGSFDSEQAIEGTKILYKKYGDVLEKESFQFATSEETYLFEIIYPENKIVVDYKDERNIFLLGVVDKKSGLEKPPQNLFFQSVDLQYVEETKSIEEELNHLINLNIPNQEGYVVQFENGLKLKLKFEDYVRLHRIVSNFSKKYLIDAMKNEVDLDLFLEGVPDEFYNEIRSWEREINERYKHLEWYYKKVYELTDKTRTRKEIALSFTNEKHPSILFNMLDGKCYRNILWKIIEQENNE